MSPGLKAYLLMIDACPYHACPIQHDASAYTQLALGLGYIREKHGRYVVTVKGSYAMGTL
jgi:hypothetical protein